MRGVKFRAKYRKEGKTAFENKLRKEDNPYKLNTPESHLWEQGYYNRGEGLQELMRLY